MFRFRLFSKIYFSFFLLAVVLLTGIVGYMLVEGYSLFDAFYMTIITVSTVGYNEVHALSSAGKVFTAFLIITSFGTFAYAITSISQYVIGGDFNRYYKTYKVNNALSKLENHVIVCGYGRNGRQAAHVLRSHNKKFVVIESDKSVVSSINEQYSEFAIHGDAKDDEVLKRAGIKTASAILTSLPVDADNVFIVLTSRYLNPKLTIISRASEDSSDAKLRIAGADNIIMPDKIGGAHMASLIMKPDVMEFVDVITGQGEDSRLEEITFNSLPKQYRNKTIKELEIGRKCGANVVGFKMSHDDYIINPSADTVIEPGAKLFVLGTTEQIQGLKDLFE